MQVLEMESRKKDPEEMAAEITDENEDDVSPIEEVRLTVTNWDDPSLPVWTFRMWFLGLISCALLSFLNQFFAYRTEPLMITQISVQVAALPIGHFMAAVLPKTTFSIPGFESRKMSFNPGPFNMKEHVLISIFANAGCAFGSGSAYAVGIVNIIKAFYGRSISFSASWILIVTTQVLGYGWAGMMRKYVVEPAHMWWPNTLVQVSLFRAMHEKDNQRMSRGKFFVIALICSFAWYVFPGYFFATLSNMSWLCWVFPNSVTAQQIGSGMRGIGLGSFALDWASIAAFMFSPLVCPFFAIANIYVGFILFTYVVMPVSYWGLNLYNAKNFPFFSSKMFTAGGQLYDVRAIVNNDFELDIPAYEKQGRLHMSTFFALTYGFGFATIVATLTHVFLFNGREIYQRFRAISTSKDDVHTKLMRKYKDIPQGWFYVLLIITIFISLIMCIKLNNQVQMPWWALIFACGLAYIFTLPIAIITATTNQTPGLNIITEYIMGLILPGKPIANVCFKVYGYISMAQAISFLSDFKLGHYMKIPPRSMFLVQLIGTIIAGTINLGVAWWLLESIENICHDQLLPPNSPWTCPGDRVFFDASIIWGLAGPKRMFGSLGVYAALNWFFILGFMGPFLVWSIHKMFPSKTWIPLINLPVLLGATAMMPPATPLNYNAWAFVGVIFNFFVFKYRKSWWQRYNYVLSAALDAGLAFMGVLLYFTLSMENKGIDWWGNGGEHCDLARCPMAKGVHVDGCPVR